MKKKNKKRKKKTQSADFCADQTDVITNFAVITNVVIKRVHCIMSLLKLWRGSDGAGGRRWWCRNVASPNT